MMRIPEPVHTLIVALDGLLASPSWCSTFPNLNPTNQPSFHPAVSGSRGTPLFYYLFSFLSHWPLQTLLNSLPLFITFPLSL